MGGGPVPPVRLAPFEPTPGRTNPVAISYAPTPATCADAPGGSDNPHGGGPPSGQHKPRPVKPLGVNEPGTQAAPPIFDVPAPAVTTRRFGARKILALAVLLAFLGFLLFPLVRAGRRRLRLRRAAASPRTLILATYDVFTERAGELGYGRPPGETLQEYRARVAASGLLRNGDLDRLTRITSEAAYAPGAPGDEEARAATSAATALRDIRGARPSRSGCGPVPSDL